MILKNHLLGGACVFKLGFDIYRHSYFARVYWTMNYAPRDHGFNKLHSFASCNAWIDPSSAI